MELIVIQRRNSQAFRDLCEAQFPANEVDFIAVGAESVTFTLEGNDVEAIRAAAKGL
jgi:hypothetical protein